MDLPPGHALVHRRLAVDGIAQHVEHAPQRLFAHGHHDAVAGGGDGQAASQTVAAGHHDAADGLVLQMLLHLHGVTLAVGFHGQCLVDGGQAPFGELYVDHGAGNTRDNTLFH